MKLSVIMPVYNERATIEEILRRVRAVRLEIDLSSEAVKLDKEILVIDDGSTDGTREILRGMEEESDLRILFHEENLGKGAAVRTGIAQASGDIVLSQDADLEYDPREYPQLLQPILEGRSAVVYGSRFRGPHKAMLFWNAMGNKLLTLITNILYDSTLSDMETCYKVFRAEVIKSIPLRARRFEIEPEVTAKVLKRGHRIYEVPISYTGREYHEGKKIGLRDAFQALWSLFKYRFVD